MRYSLRPATAADKAWLDQLRRAAYADLFDATWGGWDEDRHRRHFDGTWERGGIQAIEIDGRPIGMVQLTQSDDRVEVIEIQIALDHQNNGIGTQLMRDVMDRASQQGRDVVLSTGLKNAGAIRLYERLGFEATERTDSKVWMRYSGGPR